ncbi:MAG: DUF1579 family protein [candidate division Zixibacteria bacterium]|nr:DUF1579 family protein [candidate division Zixibacteria bacterium]
MKRAVVMAIVMTGLLFLPVPLLTADSTRAEAPSMMMGAPAEMKMIAALAGTWDVAMKARMDPSQPWSETRGICLNTLVLDGCGLEQKFDGQMPMGPYRGIGMIAFHRGIGKWQYTWMDNMFGAMGYYLGTFADGKLVVSGEDVMPGITMWTRITTYNITDKSYEWTMESSMDGGKAWVVSGTAVYTKK